MCTPSLDYSINPYANPTIGKWPSLTQGQESNFPTAFKHYLHKAHHKLLWCHYLHQINTHTLITTKKQKHPSTTLFFITFYISTTWIPFHLLGFFSSKILFHLILSYICNDFLLDLHVSSKFSSIMHQGSTTINLS